MGGVVVCEEAAVIVVSAMLLAGNSVCDNIKVQILSVMIGHPRLKTFVDHSRLVLNLFLAPLVTDDTGHLGRTAVVRADMAALRQLGLTSIAGCVVHRKIGSTTSNATKSPFQGHSDLKTIAAILDGLAKNFV